MIGDLKIAQIILNYTVKIQKNVLYVKVVGIVTLLNMSLDCGSMNLIPTIMMLLMKMIIMITTKM